VSEILRETRQLNLLVLKLLFLCAASGHVSSCAGFRMTAYSQSMSRR
jgi:hypothetical protein